MMLKAIITDNLYIVCGNVGIHGDDDKEDHAMVLMVMPKMIMMIMRRKKKKRVNKMKCYSSNFPQAFC